jgi:hypothetical protein
VFLQGMIEIINASVKIDFVLAGIRSEPFPNEYLELYCLIELAL